MPDNFTSNGRDLVGRRIDHGRLELVSVLGVGAYGVVYLAVDVRQRALSPAGPHGYVAVKCLPRTGLDERQRHFQRREISLHKLASGHPHITAVQKVLEEDAYIFVVLDYCPGGDLFAMITDRQRYVGDDELVRKVFLQIIDAVTYCHAMGIFHRDLKPENILCSADGSRVFLADFGLATTERMSTDFGCGSTFYLSPECQGGLFDPVDAYSTAQADLWSLGVILVNLACGRNPWRQACADDDTFRAYLDDPSLLASILPLSSASSTILAALFARDPTKRIGLGQLRAMVVAAPSFSTTRPLQQQLPSPAPSPKASPASFYDWSSDDARTSNSGHQHQHHEQHARAHDHHYHRHYASPSGTPASTPSLIEDNNIDPFTPGRTASISSSGSVPPTPELGPITVTRAVPTIAPAPEPRWAKAKAAAAAAAVAAAANAVGDEAAAVAAKVRLHQRTHHVVHHHHHHHHNPHGHPQVGHSVDTDVDYLLAATAFAL